MVHLPLPPPLHMYALPSLSAVLLVPKSPDVEIQPNILSKRPSSEPQSFISHHLHTLAHMP